MSYIDLPGFVPMATESATLTIPFSVALLQAIERSSAFTLVQLGDVDASGYPGEVLVVDLRCDAVPTQCPVDIGYPERLAIVVRPGGASIPEVYPLRSNFPEVWHRNWPLPGYPPDLCMYFEPVRSTLRTLTGESFLKRIFWWIESTASETLHAADQPVEQLFFRTRYEIVLPHDFEVRQQAAEPFFFSRIVSRPNGTATLIGGFGAEGEGGVKPNAFATFVLIDVPPTVHGAAERSPATLGDLHDRLSQQGLNLRDFLSNHIRTLCPAGGVQRTAGARGMLLMLRMPVSRELNGAIETVQHRAFFIDVPCFAVGKQVGALVELDEKYYSATMLLGAVEDNQEWRSIEIDATEVLFQNDQEAARRQSGVRNAGPKGAILGVGSLGSAMYDLWVRSGWGAWTVVDKDRVKPHNITRHVATYQDVGVSKVEAVLERARAIAVGNTHFAKIDADVVESADPALEELLTASEIVVDVTTTLDYPRKAAVNAKYARHVSVFITPSGGDSVLLFEDAARKTILVSLEAQYYRAMIANDWGAMHLRSNGSTFWSGAGCRDISVSLPYSSVLAHAATQSEQVMMLSSEDTAAIRVWVRDQRAGTVDAHVITPEEQITYTLGEFTGYFDKGLEAKLFELRKAGLPNETGGILLGYWDFNINALVLVDALPAPADSVASSGSFIRGTEGLLEAIAEVHRRTAGVVGYVGEWHSHPPGMRAQPSNDDLAQLAILAQRMAADGMPIASLIVGEGEIKLMQGRAL